MAELLDSGACQPWTSIPRWVDRFLRFHHSEAQSQAEDILQELQVFLRKPDFRLPADFVPDAQHLHPYLRSVVLNLASDFLRRERLAPKVRCGACLYRGPAGRCTRATSINGGGREGPHPHFDRAVDPGANPHSLVPPCREFFWRYRPLRLDEINERRRAVEPRERLASEEVAGLLVNALEELVRAGSSGRRRALILEEHFLRGRTAAAIGERLGLNERTVRRNIKSGLSALRVILRERIGVREEDLL